MASERPHRDKSTQDLLAELTALCEDHRTPAAGVIEELLRRDFSVRYIARETGLARTTLHRWAETTA
jgi:hypothetical protein